MLAAAPAVATSCAPWCHHLTCAALPRRCSERAPVLEPDLIALLNPGGQRRRLRSEDSAEDAELLALRFERVERLERNLTQVRTPPRPSACRLQGRRTCSCAPSTPPPGAIPLQVLPLHSSGAARCTGPFITGGCGKGQIQALTWHTLHQIDIWLFLLGSFQAFLSGLQRRPKSWLLLGGRVCTNAAGLHPARAHTT